MRRNDDAFAVVPRRPAEPLKASAAIHGAGATG
jgi:hypothetical protein